MSNDSTEDVSDFLLRIKELGDKRDKEDEERTRKLEEEILQGRKERQARRAERARSISPTKDSPLSDLSEQAGLRASLHRSLIHPPLDLQPSAHTPQTNNPESPLDRETENEFVARDTSTSPTATSSRDRAGSGVDAPSSPRTLSWQRRPTSNSPQLEPTQFATSQTRDNTMPSEDEKTPSRTQVSLALGSKDPSWFRQTPDRGVGSLALQKNGETMSDVSPTGAELNLPGLSRESTTEPEKPAAQDLAADRSRSPSRASSTFGTNSVGNRYSSVSSVSTTGGLGSPIPLSSSQRLDARKGEAPPSGSEDRFPMSPGRSSPERPVSPTKGLGGFVQSAMMKRSDSISKRWSAQAPPRSSRSNSIVSNVSNRSGVGRPGFADLITTPTDPKIPRENSPLSTSRPSSSHSEATVVHHIKTNEDPESSEVVGSRGGSRTDNGFVRPSLPPHARSMSSVTKDDAKVPDVDPPTPKSPTRNIDPKRWSPTKATWLESALNRPESPRPKSQASQPPAWLKDLNRTRQSRSSVDLGKPSGFKEVTPLGSMRSPPGSHFKKPSVSGIDEVMVNSETVDAKHTESDPSVHRQKIASPTADKVETPESLVKESTKLLEPDFTSQPDPSTRKTSPPVLSPKPNLTSRPEPTTKPKQQPGVVDFRANLRRRELANDNAPQNVPEFKNVFGKLRKTEKSNYVASDELKENIMRGKAALNLTGGPKKTQRVDELKESILKQKEAMKAGGGSVRRSVDDPFLSRPVAAVPEAISRRNNLSRADSINSNISASSSTSPIAERGSWKDGQLSSKQASNNEQSQSSSRPTSVVDRAGCSDTRSAFHEDAFTKDTPSRVGSNELVPEPESAPTTAVQKDSQGETLEPVRPLPSRDNVGAAKVAAATRELATKGTLADRLNPALANILSRGPPPVCREAEKPSAGSVSTITPNDTDTSSSAPLIHMTRDRARGPKRRTPKSTPSSTGSISMQGARLSIKNEGTEIESKLLVNMTQQIDRPFSEPLPSTVALASTLASDISNSASQNKLGGDRRKPTIANKSLELKRPTFSPSSVRNTAQETKKPQSQGSLETLPSKRYMGPEGPNPTPQVIQQKSVELESSLDKRPTPPPKSTTLYASPAIVGNRNLTGTLSPSSSFTSKLRDSIVNSASMSPLQSKLGLGLGGAIFQSKQDSPRDTGSPSWSEMASASPPVPPKKIDISLNTSVDPRRPSLTSPIPRTSESTRVISDFFDVVPKSSDRVDIDPQLTLTAEMNSPKTRTIKKQIWEITGDGKKQDLPVNQEYILFEGSMYLCVHGFESSSGHKTEVYLWCGDEVGEAAIDDAQLFSRKVARENGSKLELLRQGKETASFIQALGGIIITRRGSSSRSSSSALYILCGRRHLGQIAFDEVDFSLQSLCSGFPFVISAKFGKLYLWKGKGSGADEIGGARLIGMDLGLTGEIEEVSEGQEPENFFEVFPNHGAIESYQTNDYWHLKPNHEKYRCRLLRVDHELGQKTGFWNRRGSSSPITRPNDTVQEVEPFCQKDLRARDIYILDAFFELYVIVGDDAASRAAEFASALVFAHEYGILAVSLQDRPFIPRGFVAIGGIPDGCKTAFRKWDRRAWQATPHLLPLNAAIEAIRS